MRTQLLGLSLAAASIVAVVYYRNRSSGAAGDALEEIVTGFKKLGDGATYAKEPLPLEVKAMEEKRVAATTVSPTGSTSGARGIRNNNPGNIRRSTEKWQGLALVQNDPAFFQFTHAKYGVRAIGKILTTYRTRYSLTNVRDLIARWAPPVENNTQSYVDQVARTLGVKADATIDVQKRLPDLAAAIIRHENGSNPYTAAQIIEWVYLT